MEEEKSVFDKMLDIGSEPEGSEEDKDKPSDEKLEDSKSKEYQKLEENYKSLQELVGKQSDQIKGLAESKESFNKVKQAFLPSDEENDKEEQRVLSDTFDTNPVTFIDARIEEKMKKLAQRQEDSDIDRFAKEVMMDIDKEYDVPWDKVSNKIASELINFDEEFKHSNPKRAVLKAMSLAKVGKKREKPLPYYESSTYNDSARKKEDNDFKSNYMKGLREAAKDINKNPFDAFYKN
jgi:hypothetical protein